MGTNTIQPDFLALHTHRHIRHISAPSGEDLVFNTSQAFTSASGAERRWGRNVSTDRRACVCVCVCLCVQVVMARLGTRIYSEKKSSGRGVQRQAEWLRRPLKPWLRYQLHSLTWDHCLLLIIIYESFIRHLIPSLGVALDKNEVNQGPSPSELILALH
jgi:hypothetical protein